MAEPKWKSAPVVGGYQDAPPVDAPTEPVAEEAPKGILSEVIKGMVQAGPAGGMLRGVYAGLPQIMDAQSKFIEGGAYKAGGAVTDFASSAGAPPEVAGGLGFATNVAAQSVPAVVGGQIAGLTAAPLQAGSKRLMQSALKPTIADLKSGKAATAIDALLEEGFNPTKGGVEKMRALVNDLGFRVKSAIANSTETVSKGEVGKRVLETYNKFRNQVNPDADLATIKKAWLEFRNHPLLAGKTDIPVQIAQDLKQGTGRMLDKKYGQMGTADVEAQKAIVRGLKEEISKKVPEVAGLNARESRLITAYKVAERRALQESNKNPVGMTLLASHPAAALGFLADRSALAKSLLARLLYSGSDIVPANSGRAVGGLLGYASGRSMDRQHGH